MTAIPITKKPANRSASATFRAKQRPRTSGFPPPPRVARRAGACQCCTPDRIPASERRGGVALPAVPRSRPEDRDDGHKYSGEGVQGSVRGLLFCGCFCRCSRATRVSPTRLSQRLRDVGGYHLLRRALHPEFPGLLDLPTWQIGRTWCRPRDPRCSDCYMQPVCPTAAAVG